MKGQGSYVPPKYLPLEQSSLDPDVVLGNDGTSSGQGALEPTQWSSGICACCDDMQSCCIGLFCPCFLFGKNAEFLGTGPCIGPCMMHFILWGLVNGLCCLFTGGILWWLPGSIVSCYACGYRRALRAKYNLPEVPCGDFTTHMFCHLCAICQEYREIRDRVDNFNLHDLDLSAVTAPPVQTMEPASRE